MESKGSNLLALPIFDAPELWYLSTKYLPWLLISPIVEYCPGPKGFINWIRYILMSIKRIMELPSDTITNPLEIISIRFIVIFARPRNSSNLILVDQSLFGIMRKAISSSFLNIFIKIALFAIMVRGRETWLICQSKLITIAKWSSSPIQWCNLVIIVWCRRDIIGICESISFREWIKLLWDWSVHRRVQSKPSLSHQ